jgi:hypothetical protein
MTICEEFHRQFGSINDVRGSCKSFVGGSDFPNYCKYIYLMVLMIIMISISSVVVSKNNETTDLIDIRTDFMNQIGADWSMNPYTDLIVVTTMSCPETHPATVFDRFWAGSRTGCDCNSFDRRYEIY